MIIAKDIKVIGFDADDTLWDNELYFREVEDKFGKLLEEYAPGHTVMRELLKVEIENIPLYGYGIKAFILSMLEAGMAITNDNLPPNAVNSILKLGKEMLDKPVTLLPDIETVLKHLKPHFKLVIATKGDLLDQERKLKKSGLSHYFHHIEVMSEKKESDYQKLLNHLDIEAKEFVMIGNSLKSDILPIINLGGTAVHIPYHTTWALEVIDATIESDRFHKLDKVDGLLDLIKNED